MPHAVEQNPHGVFQTTGAANTSPGSPSMTADPSHEKALELRYHSAMPGWCKVIGLRIRAIPECEGGGFAVAQPQAEAIVQALTSLVPEDVAGVVKRLRMFFEGTEEEDAKNPGIRLMREGADTIERLSADNARLREAAIDVYDGYWKACRDQQDEKRRTGNVGSIHFDIWESKLDALKEVVCRAALSPQHDRKNG